jgi:hypothetical protein
LATLKGPARNVIGPSGFFAPEFGKSGEKCTVLTLAIGFSP